MKIYEALADIGIPVTHPPYTGDEANYITYQILGQDGTLYAEGREQETAVTYALTLFMDSFDAALIPTVKGALETNGYIVTVEGEAYDKDKKVNQISFIATTEGAEYG